MLFWRNVIQMGVRPAMSLLLQDRLRFANRLGLIIAGVGIALCIVYLSLGRSNVQILLVMASFGLAVPFLNGMGAHYLTRVLLSLAPALTVTVFDIALKSSKPQNLEIVSYITPRFVVLSSMMLPLVLFVYREKWLRNALVLFIILLAFNLDSVYRFAGVHFTQIRPDLASSARVYGLQTINYAIVTVILLASTSFILYTNRKNELRNDEILLEARATNLRLQESETKLKEALELMQQSKQEIERNSYVSSGLAHFLKLLRQEKDFEKLAQLVLGNLASYLHIQQGALYWIQEKNEDAFLHLKATYALTLEQAKRATFLPEEGLVGAVFLRKKIMHITDMPENHAYISSGLGEGKAREVILLPLVIDEKPMGVIELATFYPLLAHHIELLAQVAESVATTLHNIEMNKRSELALEELQRFKSKISYL
jgi:GAF domain